MVTLPLFLSFLLMIGVAQGAGMPPTEKCPQQKTGSGAEKSSLNLGAGSNNETCKPKDDEGFYEGKPYEWQCFETTKVMKNILGKPCDVKDPKSGVTTPGKCDYAEACKASNPTGQTPPGGAPQGGEQKPAGDPKQGEGGMPKMPEMPQGGGGSGSGGGGQPPPSPQSGSGQPQEGKDTGGLLGKNANTPDGRGLDAEGNPLPAGSADAQSQHQEGWTGDENGPGDRANPFTSNMQALQNAARDLASPFSDAASQLMNASEQRTGLNGLGSGSGHAPIPTGMEIGSIAPPSAEGGSMGSPQGYTPTPSGQYDPGSGFVNDAGYRASASFTGGSLDGTSPAPSFFQRVQAAFSNAFGPLIRPIGDALGF